MFHSSPLQPTPLIPRKATGRQTDRAVSEMDADAATEGDENQSLLTPAAAGNLRDGTVNSSGLLLWIGPALLAG